VSIGEMLSGLWPGSLEWRDPLFLLGALLAPLVYALAARLPASLTYSSLALARRGPRSLRARLANLPAVLLGLAIVLLALALAGPRTGEATAKVRREGVAIMLVVDRSGSMDARDFVASDQSVSRLDAVKRVLGEFVLGGEAGRGRPDDLIGVVAFGTYADAICPLTLDHRNLMGILEDLAVATERTEQATAIGEGLALAVERLRRQGAKSKIAILLTDGVNNAGEIAPLQAAELALAQGVRVYTVGAGTTGIAPMPMRSGSGRIVLRPAPVEIDEKTLEAIAARTGGRYFHARDAAALAETYREIDRLERSELTEVRYLQYEEHYPPLVLAALALTAAALLAGATVLRRLPG
jgi:Ca-activated chloride channel family protein